MTSLGFENYSEALKIYLSKYREVGSPPPNYQTCYTGDISELMACRSSLSRTGVRTSRIGQAAKEATVLRGPRAVHQTQRLQPSKLVT